MANEYVTGVVVLKINGRSIRSQDGASLKLGGKTRTARMADGQIVGFSAMPVPSEVTAELLHTSIADVDAINALEDGTLSFECDSGPVYTVSNAFCTTPPEIKGGENSSVSVSFQGQAAIRSS